MSNINPELSYKKEQPIQIPEKEKTKEQGFHTEIVDLPSKGLLYEDDNPLKSGKVELKYMTAREEDILTSQNLIKQGVVIDKLLKSLIVSNGNGETDIPYHKLLIGDKNGIMIAARVLAYGKDYEVEIKDPFSDKNQRVVIDLLTLEDKKVDPELYKNGNIFTLELPVSKKNIQFRLLTHGDTIRIDSELKALKKSKTEYDPELTLRLKNIITSVEGETDKQKISKFIDNMLSRDTLELRKYINKITPDIDSRFLFISDETGDEKWMDIPLGVSFFWPGVGL